MRKYMRHPSDIPIDLEIQGSGRDEKTYLNNVSVGGLSFQSLKRVTPGSVICIRISCVTPVFEAQGRVSWCERVDGHYDVGIEFLDQEDAYRARMVEQVCHIEHYKKQVLLREGRKLTGEQAAMEWISKFASDFPSLGMEG